MPRIWDNFSDARRKAPKTECVHRIGPAPREDIITASDRTANIGTLDSDVDDDLKDDRCAKVRTKNAAGSRALIIYFSKLAKKSSAETIDYRFLESLFKSGAEVNAHDKHGQTAIFEVARNWNVDVAKFFVHHGADINHADKRGRTPLHLAAAVNHFEMLEYLIKNGGNMHARSIGEEQTPMHFAAKYNAIGSLKVMIENKGDINVRDYKKRTPIFLAAEMAQEDSARYLVEFGAPVGVFDDTGMSAIGCMVEKMPHVALDALDQFQVTDTAFRKDYFYLNYLEYDPLKWKKENITEDEFGMTIIPDKKEKKRLKKERRLACPTTALHLAVKLGEFEIIMHPVIQQLIKQKWKIFGRFGAIGAAVIHFIFIMIWTWLAIFLPGGGKYYDSGIEWKLVLEISGVLLTFYFILKQIWENKLKYRDNQKFRIWRTRQINRDLEFCHPRWAQEKSFLESEMKSTHSGGESLLSNPWNILDFLTYVSVLVVIVTRLIYVFVKSDKTDKIHRKTYSALLIFMWLHFMKSCRPFTTLGPFITMLGHVIIDTGKFAFLFFEFFIPYTVGFWILFGGHLHGKQMEAAGEEASDWEKFNDLVYSVWLVTLNVDFNINALYCVSRIFTQIMVGTFFALSTVLCLNLYIALLSETFNQVYQNAKSNASLLQANTILQIEKALSRKRQEKARNCIQEECSPLEQPQEEDKAGISEQELWDRTVRIVLTRFTRLNDFLKLKRNSVNEKLAIVKLPNQNELMRQKYKEEKETYESYQVLLARDHELYQLLLDVYEMKCIALKYLAEGNHLPPRPIHKPFPVLNIKHPQPILLTQLPPKKIISAPTEWKDQNIVLTERSDQNKVPTEWRDENKVFRQITRGKTPVVNMTVIDETVSASWENLPSLSS